MNPHQDVVLVVEDDPDDQNLITRAFKKAKVEVPLRFANDGDQALTFLADTLHDATALRPVVVLLDLKLPRRSGFEVLAWVKQHETLRRVPVVVLTSSREGVDLERAYDLGANSYLVKPVRFDALYDIAKTLDLYWLALSEKPDLGQDRERGDLRPPAVA